MSDEMEHLWEKAKDIADKTIGTGTNADHALYDLRAGANRNTGKLDEAIADYDRVIELDPHNADAWTQRGACKMQRAAAEQDRAKSIAMMNEAHVDYRRAAELSPDDELTGLALLEFEICVGKYTEAVGTTGEWWDRVQKGSNKMVCAWLGAIAMILAGRPERRWAHLRDHLQSDQRRLMPWAWCLDEIKQHLKFLESQPGVDLTQVKAIHELFLSHFG